MTELELPKICTIISYAFLILFLSPVVQVSGRTTLLLSEPSTSLDNGEEGNVFMLRLRGNIAGKITLSSAVLALIFLVYKLWRSCSKSDVTCTTSETPEGGHGHTQVTLGETNSVEINSELDVISSVKTDSGLDVISSVEINSELDVISSVKIDSGLEVISSVDSIEVISPCR